MRFDRYDRIVDHYVGMWPMIVPGYVPILNAMHDVVRCLGSKPQKLLDVGCGPGSATIAVAAASHPEGGVTLIDGSKKMIRAAERILGNHVESVHHGDFTTSEVDAAFATNAYDLVLCSFALHHHPDRTKREVIEKIGRSIKLNGLLLLADEVAVDRPAGWDIIERIRGRIVQDHVGSGRITQEFWELETSLPTELHLPFLPSKVEELTSFMARAGMAVSCPIMIFGSALLIGVKTSI